MDAITCSDLVKIYKTQKLVRALDGVSLSVAEGEVFGLLGPNGAGKTTLVKVLTTLLKASSGHAEVGGYDVDAEEDEVRQIIGYAGQDSERSAYFRLTVRENLLYFAHGLRDVPKETAKERIAEIASAIGFSDRLDKHFIALSGGEKQLVIVMRAILHNPQVYFLDEPSKSLDPLTARRVRKYLKAYAKKRGITVCLTTHNMREAEEICDRIAFINRGRLRLVGTLSEFKRRVTVKEIVEIGVPKLDNLVESRLLTLPGVSNLTHGLNTRLYCDDAFSLLPEVLEILKSAKAKVPVRMVEPSLEDAFAVLVHEDEVRRSA